MTYRMGNSWNVNVGFLSYERGATQGNGYKNFGQPTLQTPRSYIYNSGSQAGHYPAAQLNNISPKAQFKGISGGGMISSTRTFFLKFKVMEKEKEGSVLFLIIFGAGIAVLIYFQVYKKDKLFYLREAFTSNIEQDAGHTKVKSPK